MFASKPRPVAVRAKVPWTSSQARTHRPHEMHRSCLKVRYGWRSSAGRGGWTSPGHRGSPISSRAATSASSLSSGGGTGSSESTSSTTAVATRLARGSSVWISMSSTQGVVQAGITARASSSALA